ncbi:hypothetical protein [Sphingobacterium spiritivorum]|uniref:hypothetical protein n=1 Tax=Sphingobacterium spiritivorum TaxID=258 RepID=UPI003DA61F85
MNNFSPSRDSRYGRRIGLHTIFPDGRVPDRVAKGSETSYLYPPIRIWTSSDVGTQGRGLHR